MPIDTPYNRMVTDKYNALIRDKVDHEMDTLQTVLPAPAGFDVNGYNPKVMGSGVGVYHKGDGDRVVGSGISATLCGHGNARGGANLGLQPAVRVELALGAGLRGNRTSKHGCLDRHEEFNGSGKKDCPLGHEVCSCGSGSARGGFLGIDKLLGLLGSGVESGHVNGGFLSDILAMFGRGSARGGLGKQPAFSNTTRVNARGGFMGKLFSLLGSGVESGHVDGGFLSDIMKMFGMGSARGNARGGFYKNPIAASRSLVRTGDKITDEVRHQTRPAIKALKYSGNVNRAMSGEGNARGGKGGKAKPKSKPSASKPKPKPAAPKPSAPKPSAPKPSAPKPKPTAPKSKPATKKPEEKKKPRSWGDFANDTVKGVEDTVKGIEKAADIGEKAYRYGKLASSFIPKGYMPQALQAPEQAQAPEPAPDAEAPAGSGKRGVSRRHRHAAVRGVSANGNARGGSRASIVKAIMKKLALPLIEASKYVKAHNLY